MAKKMTMGLEEISKTRMRAIWKQCWDVRSLEPCWEVHPCDYTAANDAAEACSPLPDRYFYSSSTDLIEIAGWRINKPPIGVMHIPARINRAAHPSGQERHTEAR